MSEVMDNILEETQQRGMCLKNICVDMGGRTRSIKIMELELFKKKSEGTG